MNVTTAPRTHNGVTTACPTGYRYVCATPNQHRVFTDLGEARAFIERGVPALKRGWTADWQQITPATFRLRVLNSKGRFITGALLTIKDAA